MIIDPPDDSWVHEPTEQDKEAQKELVPLISAMEQARVRAYLDVQNWMCPVCMAVNFGRNQKCAYCFGRRGVTTLRNPD